MPLLQKIATIVASNVIFTTAIALACFATTAVDAVVNTATINMSIGLEGQKQ